MISENVARREIAQSDRRVAQGRDEYDGVVMLVGNIQAVTWSCQAAAGSSAASLDSIAPRASSQRRCTASKRPKLVASSSRSRPR